VVTNALSASVGVLLGTADGQLGRTQVYQSGPQPSGVAIADLDGDGHLDLAIANFFDNLANPPGGAVTVLRADGKGGFAPPVRYPFGDGLSSIAALDIDGDGKVDLVGVSSNQGTVSTAVNDGSGGFVAGPSYMMGWSAAYVLTTDLNGDGHADLAVETGGAGYVAVALASASGPWRTALTISESSYGAAVGVGDIDGDGIADVVTTGEDGGGAPVGQVSLGTRAGQFATGASFSLPDWAAVIAIGDLTGDGRADVVMGSASGSVGVLRNVGGGKLGVATSYNAQYQPSAIALGDLDRDGALDVVTGGGESINVLRNLGAGVLDAPSYYQLTSTVTSLALGDLNGDARLDLVVGTVGGVGVMLNQGAGQFGEARWFYDTADVEGVAIGDLDGDGKLDVVVGTGPYSIACGAEGGTVDVLLGDGHGRLSLRGAYGSGWFGAVAAVDLDGDGHLDVAAADQTGPLRLFPNDGAGGLGRPTSYATLGGRVLPGDFDGNGRPDLAVGGAYGGVGVLLNRAH
jgi:hypothetical protein